VGEFSMTGNLPMNSKTVTVYSFNRSIPIMQDDREVEIRRWASSRGKKKQKERERDRGSEKEEAETKQGTRERESET
jgi:hypothetical protein